ncbi:MAG: class I SAM-dependent RNA methyltransferase [Eubacteriales bacterium]|nr:class I SAM-dependent RNA methyltransferase [Eubacteriales bacterium]
MNKLDLIATAAFGVESVVSRELKKLGYFDQHTDNGRISFKGNPEAICRTNLWLRCAERVLLKMGEFKALSFEELFQGTKALPWDEILPENARFPVEGKSIRSKLYSVPDCQAIVKKAVVEKLKQKYRREIFPEDGPLYKLEVALLDDIAVLTIDTSGAGLHKRGYRKLSVEAPLRETLACALIDLSRWKGDRVLYDPFCGSGTIPVEAAMIALNIAPGIKRTFISEEWPQLPSRLWRQAREEAVSSAAAAAQNVPELRIHGSDIDAQAVSIARYHAAQAGVEKHIHFQKLDIREISSRFKYGYIICNPPYGERMGEAGEAEALYRDISKVFRTFDTWSFHILTSHMGFERQYGRRADHNRKLYNGMIMCRLYQYYGPKPPAAIPAGSAY